MIKKIKKFFSLIISLVVLLFSAGMIISLLDFFDVIDLPEIISLKHYLIETDEVLLVSGDDSLAYFSSPIKQILLSKSCYISKFIVS